MWVARRAGIQQAASVTPTRNAATPAMVSGSCTLTSKSKPRINFFIRKELTSQLLADDHYVRHQSFFAIRECSPAQQGNPHRLEIIRAHHLYFRHAILPRWRCRFADDVEACTRCHASKRKGIVGGRRAHSTVCADARSQGEHNNRGKRGFAPEHASGIA